ncbi:N-acetyltransferase [Streptomyces sp. FXJ1.172]|uniref:GNAT family N-acetyltransferase n=1 Tax=Streptomyces sp. FXJ1.172 TaxID=710705 RepID=UPI0007CF3FC3|nr:N-acetyltransferase [Streptomyces sp. FXJ1.172]WEO99645.1 N-acetyltransferase [Streptomyces sp. FXJ1.172]
MVNAWTTRAEAPGDIPAIREVNLAAFGTPLEADLVDALRADASWIEGLSVVTTAADGTVVGHALLTRCHIADTPALCLAPVAVRPGHQRTGAGSAAVHAVLQAAEGRGECHVVVLGDPSFYSRFGFGRASEHGIGVSIDVPDEALMALTLDPGRPLPSGVVRYAAPFGI